MKIINWICDVVSFTIYTVLISFGLWMLVYGLSIHNWQIEMFGLGVLCISMFGIALDWHSKTKRFINGENETN